MSAVDQSVVGKQSVEELYRVGLFEAIAVTERGAVRQSTQRQAQRGGVYHQCVPEFDPVLRFSHPGKRESDRDLAVGRAQKRHIVGL